MFGATTFSITTLSITLYKVHSECLECDDLCIVMLNVVAPMFGFSPLIFSRM
jgi:hypothetical protein